MRFLIPITALAVLLLAACSAQAPVSLPTGSPKPAPSPTSARLATVEPTLAPSLTPSILAPTNVPQAATSATPSAAPTDTAPATSSSGAQNCGQVTMLGPNPPMDPTAIKSEQCFWQAFQNCRPAMLTVAIRGVDAGTMHQFTVEKGGSVCRVKDTVQSYVVPIRTPAPQTVDCTSLVQRDGGLLFASCGDRGDIFVPAPKAP